MKITAANNQNTFSSQKVDLWVAQLISDRCSWIKAIVTARRRDGIDGVAEDCAVFELEGLYKKVNGQAQLVPNTYKQRVVYRPSGAWNANLLTTQGNVRIWVEGQQNVNIEWWANVDMYLA